MNDRLKELLLDKLTFSLNRDILIFIRYLSHYPFVCFAFVKLNELIGQQNPIMNLYEIE